MELQERIGRLEKQNRRLTASTIFLGFILAAGAVMGAMPRDTTPSTLKDSQGRVRVNLYVHPDYGPILSMFDNNGKERLRIGSDQNDEGNAYLWLYDQNGNRVKRLEQVKVN